MTEPTPEVDVDRTEDAAGAQAGPGAGQPVLEALSKLSERFDRLQSLAVEEHARAADLREALNRIQNAVGSQTTDGVLEELQRLRGLDEEAGKWAREKESILKAVEGLIDKVDSLTGQL
jgi:hypothetical protein